MEAYLTLVAAQPAAARITQRHANGSITVRMPLLSVASIDAAQTAGGGTGTIAITRADLEQIAANLAVWPGPVPIHPEPHRPFSETGGPAPGFVDALEVEGDLLMGTLTLNQPLAAQYESGAWRGFSVDIAKSPKLPSVQIDGWAMWGGVLTNRPAAPVNYRVEGLAASATEFLTIQTPFQEESMSEEIITPAVDETAKLRASLETRNVELSRAQADVSTLSAQLQQRKAVIDDQDRRILQLEADLRGANAKITAQETEALSAKVRRIAHDAVNRGVAPAFFEGVETDAAAWFRARFSSLDTFETLVKALPAQQSEAVSSRVSTDDPADTPAIGSERIAALKALGLDPKYATITNENQLRQMK